MSEKFSIERAVSLLMSHGGWTELRVMNVPKAGTVSGYFDKNNHAKVVDAACELSGTVSAVYVTLNPAMDDVSARAFNNAKRFAKSTTSDKEIVKRWWLPIDVDAVRPAGISSTDAEHDAALAKAREIRSYLKELDFPDPIYADSGNGAHLLYRVDLPNEPAITELFQRFLEALAVRFDDKFAKVDKAVFNAARIWKLYGTLVCKGDDVAERPHRLAWLLDVPEKMELVSHELLEKVAGASGVLGTSVNVSKNEVDDTFNRIANSGKPDFDAKKWLVDHGITITKEKDLSGGAKLYEMDCQFNPEHTKGCAFVIQFPNRGITAGCHHNSCAEKGWKDLRELKAKPGEIQPRETIEDPDRLARLSLRDRWTHPDGWTLRRFQEQWYVWNGVVYQAVSDEELSVMLTQDIKAEFDLKSVQAQVNKDNHRRDTFASKVTGGVLAGVHNALKSKTLVSSALGSPCWIVGEHAWPAREVLVCPNGLFFLPALADGRDEKLPLTPQLFTTFALDYEIRLDAPRPGIWLSFLDDIWKKDPQAIQTLQEWMGYCLTQGTRQQKILMVVGPKRSGKSTIGRVMRSLVGTKNATGPTLSSLQDNFGLQQLLGKTLATFSDARLRGQTAIVVERLLSISGEDMLAVPRKYQGSIDVTFPTRLVFLSNELPRLEDASGALVGRMIVLSMEKSFYGEEDIELTDKLLLELPGILLWAIEGYKRLTERGKFVQPDSANPLLTELEELSNPLKAFVNENCKVGVFLKVPRAELHNAYLDWCQATGRRYPQTREMFGRDLRLACPFLADTQPVIGGERVRCYEGIELKK